jgi:hypothetical protein
MTKHSEIFREQTKNEKRIYKILDKYTGRIQKLAKDMSSDMMFVRNLTDSEWEYFYVNVDIIFSYQLTRLKNHTWDYPHLHKKWLREHKNKKINKMRKLQSYTVPLR